MASIENFIFNFHFQLVSFKLLLLVSALLPDSGFGQHAGQTGQSRQTSQATEAGDKFGDRISSDRSGKSLLNTFPFNAEHGHDHGHHDGSEAHGHHDHHQHDDDDR
jgi:ABC-type nickel/cobalt efflux system permease component RcnA